MKAFQHNLGTKIGVSKGGAVEKWGASILIEAFWWLAKLKTY